MKVAIIHYWFLGRRGGEKVIESLLKIYPNADIYTLFYDKKEYGDSLENQKVYTSILNKSFLKKHYQKIFPLYPLGIKSLKLRSSYDLIISSESGPAKGIEIPKGVPHICYVHSPMRYCWSHKEVYLNSVSRSIKPILSFFLERLRRWDETTIDNVDLYLSNSKNVSKRIKKYYHREAEVVYPPISDELFLKEVSFAKERNQYLSFGALTPYKKIDLLVETFNENGKKLVIIGDGSERKKLQLKARSNIEFKRGVTWIEIEKEISKSKALLFPGEEDFGMIPLEMMAYGLPVIAYKKGGALETVVENRLKIEESSGLFFNEQSIKSLEETIAFFEANEGKFNSIWIKNHAKTFSEEFFLVNFKKKIETFLNRKLEI
ncbi:MAG: glycosyltransferase involved in cell wall biosynthesis [Flavobacteriaceae bacterium]|jgi:glycosyltransferase involved in cell wall biosynthesis